MPEIPNTLGPLVCVTTSELLRELASRHQGTVVITNHRNDKVDSMRVWYDGGVFLARGLAMSAVEAIEESIP